jgi:hypothetical protein
VVRRGRGPKGRAGYNQESTEPHSNKWYNRWRHSEGKGPYMLSRRNFLNSTLGAGLTLAASQETVAQSSNAQGARKRMIVDAQVHVWKMESPDWPWIPGARPQMPEPPSRSSSR